MPDVMSESSGTFLLASSCVHNHVTFCLCKKTMERQGYTYIRTGLDELGYVADAASCFTMLFGNVMTYI